MSHCICTRIVVTLGPACDTVETIMKMARSGARIFRLNFSHGTYEHHQQLIDAVRTVEEDLGIPLTILQDIQGPKIRLAELPEEGIAIHEGEVVVFDTAIDTVVDGRIPVGYKQLHAAVEVGHRLLIADGKIEAVVSDLQGSKIYATVKVPGVLFSHKGLNIPDTTKRIDAITEKDIADAQFGAQHGVDYIAVSFVTKPEDIAVVRKAIAPYDQGDTPIRCIAKIERAEAVHRIDDILDVVDGIMVARGDLGVEVRAAEVPILQKDLIAKARAAYKPVIVATQMLDSMTDNPRPTRAEVSDVANAVIDHTDAVMLSNETATGSYPLEAVQIMSETIHEAEHSLYDDMTGKIGEQVAQLKATLAAKQGTGIYIADPQKYLDVLGAHPDVPLVVVAPSVRAARQWNLYWGVLPILADNDLETQYAALQAIGHRIDQLIPIEELL